MNASDVLSQNKKLVIIFLKFQLSHTKYCQHYINTWSWFQVGEKYSDLDFVEITQPTYYQNQFYLPISRVISNMFSREPL